jgi:hypothetical protein
MKERERFIQAFGGCLGVVGKKEKVFISPKGDYYIIKKIGNKAFFLSKV